MSKEIPVIVDYDETNKQYYLKNCLNSRPVHPGRNVPHNPNALTYKTHQEAVNHAEVWCRNHPPHRFYNF